jgi:hypothetical protein
VHSFVLCDWQTIRGGNGATVTQSENEWLDLEAYQDVTLWLQVSEITGSPTCTYQTSPTADDSLFQSMTSSAVTMTAGTTTVTQVLMLSATVPLARFVRWQLAGSGTWDATFRIMVAANAPGM